MIKQWLRAWLGVHTVTQAQILDINLRMEHLANRMDEAEHLLKRIHDHMPKV